MPLRIFDDSGSASSRNIANAIRYAVDNGADVINLSIDSVSTRNVNAALNYAGENNVLVVASAGNNQNQAPSFPATASSELRNVISVGSHDQSFRRWEGSNQVGSSGAIQVDAPGKDIYSATVDNSYTTSSGTSVAAAHVAGIAALALSANPMLNAFQLRDVIVRGATQNVIGSDSAGAVNALETVSLVMPSGAKATSLASDFNGDGEVGFTDFVSLARNFGKSPARHADGDANGNGVIDFVDFLIFSNDFKSALAAAPQLQTDPEVLSYTLPEEIVDAAFEHLEVF